MYGYKYLVLLKNIIREERKGQVQDCRDTFKHSIISSWIFVSGSWFGLLDNEVTIMSDESANWPNSIEVWQYMGLGTFVYNSVFAGVNLS